jgi:hypothetical protein
VVRQDESPDQVQLAGAEALIASQAGRLKPEFAGLVLATCTCGGSLPSKLVKKIRYGPGMPLIRGIQRERLLHHCGTTIAHSEPQDFLLLCWIAVELALSTLQRMKAKI